MEDDRKQVLIIKIKDCFEKNYISSQGLSQTLLIDAEGLKDALIELIEEL